MAKQILSSSTLLYAFIFISCRAVAQDSLNYHSRRFKFQALEVEAQWAPKENDIISSGNYLLELGKNSFLKSYFFGEYNFSNKEYAYTISLDPKLYGPLHLTASFENDLFGTEYSKNHFQTGFKLYLEDLKPCSNWFHIASVGVNYSLFGNAEHKLRKTEVSYNFLSNPIKINKNLALVVQSMGRIRNGYDFHFFQLGFEPTKLHHSVFMIGTGQVHEGKWDFYTGFQYAFIESHKSFRF